MRRSSAAASIFALSSGIAVALALALPGGAAGPDGLEKIEHIIIIVQENRSFDHYFGTYPGADGIPMDENGVPTVCAPDPQTDRCVKPYHDTAFKNYGGPHRHEHAMMDINSGAMDGFIKAAQQENACVPDNNPRCVTDVMGYHDRSEIPNYWAYADRFVLQDRMFEPTTSWTLPARLYLVSGWSARCRSLGDPMSCRSTFEPNNVNFNDNPNYAWTEITYLLDRFNVGWGWYIVEGYEPDCITGDPKCPKRIQKAKTPNHFNPLPFFDTVREGGHMDRIQTISKFIAAAQNGTLPPVSWVIPSDPVSDHPPSLIDDGQAYVTRLINTVMQGPHWSSSAIFLVWDDWGGFYDHVVPPVVDKMGYGLRVPGLLISPYAKRGYIDHQTLSFDAYLKFIEDRFLGGQRLDPLTDGRPDSRRKVRENVPILGDLRHEFDFDQEPQPPLILPLRP